MNTDKHEFRAARAEDLPAIGELLAACELSAQDLTPAQLGDFELACDARGRIVGLAGFERSASDALLRSLAVAPDWRGQGLAAALVTRREAQAKAIGVSRLYLLTITAADYFRRRGYSDLPRAQVPAAIAAHPQFRSLCPASAICLEKRL